MHAAVKNRVTSSILKFIVQMNSFGLQEITLDDRNYLIYFVMKHNFRLNGMKNLLHEDYLDAMHIFDKNRRKFLLFYMHFIN